MELKDLNEKKSCPKMDQLFASWLSSGFGSNFLQQLLSDRIRLKPPRMVPFHGHKK